MPQNQDPFDVIQYYLKSARWYKDKEDGLVKVTFNPLEIRSVMQSLQIESREVFEQVSGCLFELVRK